MDEHEHMTKPRSCKLASVQPHKEAKRAQENRNKTFNYVNSKITASYIIQITNAFFLSFLQLTLHLILTLWFTGHTSYLKEQQETLLKSN